MDQYPIVPADGYKLVSEDVEAGWELAGTATDKVRAMLAQVAVASSNRTGWVVPRSEGPIVVPAGATGTVTVNPFTAYRSPAGSETVDDLLSAFYAGSTETVPTPLPTAGNHRWDLLYAIVSETDGTSESRLVEDPSTGVVAAQTVNTRHRSVVTLAWVQGTSAATATNPYPSANWPALPTPASGEAHIPLAYVHVEYDATPAAVTYTIHKLAPVAPVARINPQTGAVQCHGAGLVFTGGTEVVNTSDPKASVTSSQTYQWPRALAGNRTKAFIEQPNGQMSLWIHFDFYGATLFGANWTVLTTPIFTPSAAANLGQYAPIDWTNRWFMGRLAMSRQGETFAHDFGGASAARMPTQVPSAGAVPNVCHGTGNTIASDDYFDAMGGIVAGDWYVACYFADVLSSGAANDLALLVRKSASGGGYTQGAMYLAAREAVANTIDDRSGLIKLDCTGPFSDMGL